MTTTTTTPAPAVRPEDAADLADAAKGDAGELYTFADAEDALDAAEYFGRRAQSVRIEGELVRIVW